MHRLAHEPHRPDRVALARAQRVRQPLEPLPLRARLARDQGRDDEVLGRVLHRGRQHERAGERAGRVGVAGHLDARPRPQRGGCREPGLDAVGREQPVQRRRGDRVELGERRGLRWLEGEAERLRRRAHPHLEEVAVGHGALPHPGALGRDGRQRRRVGVVPQGRLALAPGGIADGAPHLGEVGEVLAARGEHAGGVLLALAHPAGEHEPDRRQQEHAGGEPGAGAALRHRDEADRAERAHHRHGLQQQPARAVGGGDLRGGCSTMRPEGTWGACSRAPRRAATVIAFPPRVPRSDSDHRTRGYCSCRTPPEAAPRERGGGPVTAPTHQLTLVADERRYDLVVPVGTRVTDVLSVLGISSSATPSSVATASGQVYGPHDRLGDDLPAGSVLTVVRTTTHALHRDVVSIDRSSAAPGSRSSRCTVPGVGRWRSGRRRRARRPGPRRRLHPPARRPRPRRHGEPRRPARRWGRADAVASRARRRAPRRRARARRRAGPALRLAAVLAPAPRPRPAGGSGRRTPARWVAAGLLLARPSW